MEESAKIDPEVREILGDTIGNPDEMEKRVCAYISLRVQSTLVFNLLIILAESVLFGVIRSEKGFIKRRKISSTLLLELHKGWK